MLTISQQSTSMRTLSCFPWLKLYVTNNPEALAPAVATSTVVPAIPSRRPLSPCLILAWWPLRWLTSRLISGYVLTRSFFEKT